MTGSKLLFNYLSAVLVICAAQYNQEAPQACNGDAYTATVSGCNADEGSTLGPGQTQYIDKDSGSGEPTPSKPDSDSGECFGRERATACRLLDGDASAAAAHSACWGA